MYVNKIGQERTRLPLARRGSQRAGRPDQRRSQTARAAAPRALRSKTCPRRGGPRHRSVPAQCPLTDLERVAHKVCDNGSGNPTFFGLKRLPPVPRALCQACGGPGGRRPCRDPHGVEFAVRGVKEHDVKPPFAGTTPHLPPQVLNGQPAPARTSMMNDESAAI